MKTLLFMPFLFMCSMVLGQSSKIIDKTIKIGNLEVAKKDFPKKMNWNDSKIACANLGSGWRLPTKDELNLLYQNKDEIGGFADANYWSSEEVNEDDAWKQGFYDGNQHANGKISNGSVRAVRAF
jgi:hypothetical protein